MLAIEDMSDADIQEVYASADGFAGVEEATAPLSAMLSLVQAWRWLGSEIRLLHRITYATYVTHSHTYTHTTRARC